jgi:hypothetical protein
MIEHHEAQAIAVECVETFLTACQAQGNDEALQALVQLATIAAGAMVGAAGKDTALTAVLSLAQAVERFDGKVQIEMVRRH